MNHDRGRFKDRFRARLRFRLLAQGLIDLWGSQRVLSLVTLSLLCSHPLYVDAHHGEVTSRVNTTQASLIGLSRDTQVWLSLGLSYQFVDLSRALRGDQTYTKIPLGEVRAHSLSLEPRLKLRSDLYLGGSVPLSLIALQSPSRPQTKSAGIGDISLSLEQRLIKTQKLNIWVSLGGVAPTGSYANATSLSVTEISGTDQGMLQLTRYNAQASLGSGAWSALGGGRLLWIMNEKWRAGGSLFVYLPLHQTSDQLLWGPDLDNVFNIEHTAWGSLTTGLGLGYRHHFDDQLPASIDLDDQSPERSGMMLNTESDSMSSSARTGNARQEISTMFSMSYAFNSYVSCGLQIRLPLWQKARGVQLVESMSGASSCVVAWKTSER